MYEALISEYQGEFSQGHSLDEIVEMVDGLPPMPDVITRALRMLDDPDSSPEDLADVIALDPALASLILRSANSADAAQQQQVTTVEGAILVVGMARIKTVLFACALRRWNRKFGTMERLVWEKSLGAAFAAHVLCDRLKKRYRDELHLAGLLHNLGQIVLLSNKDVGAKYEDVFNRIKDNHEDFIVAERNVIGYSHPLVGALVAKKWHLPDETCRALLRYADPFEGISCAEDEKMAALKLSVVISLAGGIGRPEGYITNIEEMETLSVALGFGKNWEEDLEACTIETKERFKAESSAYAAN